MPSSSYLKPFELAILEAVAHHLSKDEGALLTKQISAVNKVQRLLQWNEVELYCMKWFKVCWPEHVLFQDKREKVLAKVGCSFGETKATVSIWSVAGHVFSLESSVALKPLQAKEPFSIDSIECYATKP